MVALNSINRQTQALARPSSQKASTSRANAGVSLSNVSADTITGDRDEFAKTLAEHDNVDAIWYAGPSAGQTAVQKASAHNMKRTWALPASGAMPAVDEMLREATQVKNIWVPYGA